MKDQFVSQKRIAYYDLLRLILVILVVISHGTYYEVTTKWGGIHYNVLMDELGIADTAFHKIAENITTYIYTFHMPVFIALSGSLFHLSKKDSFWAFVKKKAFRLMIPFVVVWLLWNLPIKYFTGYFSDVKWLGILLQMIFPANVYLWYLECLFFVFLLAYFVIKIHSPLCRTLIVGTLWLIGVFLYKKFIRWHFLGDPLYYLGWFYLGYNIETIIIGLKKKHLWSDVGVSVIFIIDVLLFVFNQSCRVRLLPTISQFFVYPISMFIVMNYISRRVKVTPLVSKMSTYGFGVYLYAEPLNYLFLYCFWKMFGIGFFGLEWGAAIICITRILATSGIAIGITHLLKKYNIKYLY